MSEETPRSAPEARQFDFWIGEWELTWDKGGKGFNIIALTQPLCKLYNIPYYIKTANMIKD